MKPHDHRGVVARIQPDSRDNPAIMVWVSGTPARWVRPRRHDDPVAAAADLFHLTKGEYSQLQRVT
jgi:hypothetical protein